MPGARHEVFKAKKKEGGHPARRRCCRGLEARAPFNPANEMKAKIAMLMLAVLPAVSTVAQMSPPRPVSDGKNIVFSAEELTRRTLQSRAVEAVIWGMPAVNFDLMYQAMVRDAKAGPGSNKIVYWSKLSDSEEPDAYA